MVWQAEIARVIASTLICDSEANKQTYRWWADNDTWHIWTAQGMTVRGTVCIFAVVSNLWWCCRSRLIPKQVKIWLLKFENRPAAIELGEMEDAFRNTTLELWRLMSQESNEYQNIIRDQMNIHIRYMNSSQMSKYADSFYKRVQGDMYRNDNTNLGTAFSAAMPVTMHDPHER